MPVLLLALPVVSFLVLGAHFMREGAVFLALACAAFAVATAWRTPWVSRLVQAALVLGTVEWLWTAYILAQHRIAMGRPWSRMVLILTVVVFVTVASIAAVEALRRRRIAEIQRGACPQVPRQA